MEHTHSAAMTAHALHFRAHSTSPRPRIKPSISRFSLPTTLPTVPTLILATNHSRSSVHRRTITTCPRITTGTAACARGTTSRRAIRHKSETSQRGASGATVRITGAGYVASTCHLNLSRVHTRQRRELMSETSPSRVDCAIYRTVFRSKLYCNQL
jgi:hypothetical protein